MTKIRLLLLLPLALAAACDKNGARHPNPNGRPTATSAEKPAIDALARGDFAGARKAADEVLQRTPDAARAAAVRAVSRYQAAGIALFARLSALEGALESRDTARVDSELRAALLAADEHLAAVDADLAIAEADPTFALELCIACWSLRLDPRQGRSRARPAHAARSSTTPAAPSCRRAIPGGDRPSASTTATSSGRAR